MKRGGPSTEPWWGFSGTRGQWERSSCWWRWIIFCQSGRKVSKWAPSVMMRKGCRRERWIGLLIVLNTAERPRRKKMKMTNGRLPLGEEEIDCISKDGGVSALFFGTIQIDRSCYCWGGVLFVRQRHVQTFWQKLQVRIQKLLMISR